FDMLKDRQGNLWLATEYGVSFWGQATKKFFSMASDEGLSSTGINGFYLENDSILWIASSQGLNRYNRKNGRIRTYLTKRDNGVDGVNVFMTEIHPGPENKIWIVSRDSIRLFDTKTTKYTTYRPEGEIYRKRGMVRKDFFFSLMDKHGNIWLTGMGNVYYFDTKTRTFKIYEDLIKATNITSIFIDRNETFWLGTPKGLFVFDKKNEFAFPFAGFDDSPKPFDGIQIKSIRESKDGKLWVGTVEGIYVIEMEEGVIRRYHEPEGLPNAYIRSFEEDKQGNFWIATNKGISKFEPQTEEFTTYTKADGLVWDEMQSRGSWKSPAGEMFFGSMNGFSSFFPEEIKANSFPPNVYLTDFSILNEPVPIGAPDSFNRNHQFFLNQEINHTKEIHLTYQHRVFSFEFAALNYLQPQKNQYAYMLEGFDDEWIYTNIRKATYTNIDPGEYTFKVKGSNNDGIWSEENAELKIIIHPPWWKTWWAYGIYVFLITVAVWWIFRMRMEALRREMKTKARIEKAKMDEREKVRARSSRDFHDEAGNKLTKISLYTGLLRNKATSDHEMMDFVNGIETNLKELSSGMRDFIWVLDPKHDSLSDTLMRIKEFGDGLFEHSGTAFIYVNKIPESFQVNLDLNTRRNLLMIFKEGMNNALKYANAHEVKMIAELKEEKIAISLIDDGMGFDRTNLSRVNGLNNMKTRASESGGELIFDASPGIGTAITFIKQIHPKG
ncbi:MAG: hypothetical protein KDD63_10940, partial [Bacteroidetes bacterium]|nr:hypothetical protein [Bacteroidota bacterium]